MCKIPSSWPPALIVRPRLEWAVEVVIGVHDIPKKSVELVEEDRRIDCLAQRDCGVDVVVVPMRQHDAGDVAAVDGIQDRLMIVRRVEDHDFLVVADQPDVVGDLPLAAVEGEDAVRGDQFDRHSTTTERSTSPRSIL